MRAATLIAAVLAAACSGTPTSPTAASATPPIATTTQFAGTLGPGASRFFSFAASRSGTVVATLASATIPPFNAAADVALGIGIGRPAGTGCPTVTSLTTDAGLTTQLQHGVDAGIYCINVYDPGMLPATVQFVVRFSYP